MEYNTIMEIGTIRNLLIALAVFLGATFIAYQIGRRDGLIHATENSIPVVDTLFLRDPIPHEKPIYVDRIRLQKVPILVENTDTLWKHDTLIVYLQKEQVVWEDEFSKVYASGIHPQVDSVQHYIKERVVTIEKTISAKKPCRWGIGVQVGYGVQFGDQIYHAPYLGIGVSYNLLSW